MCPVQCLVTGERGYFIIELLSLFWCPQWEFAIKCSNDMDGVQAIVTQQVDVVFLLWHDLCACEVDVF